jgi:xylulokinase
VLPSPVPSGTLVGRVRPEAAAATGLGRHTAVVSGGHDHLVGALGAGVVRPGAVLDSTGTAAVVLMLSAAFDPRRALFDAGLETYGFVQPGTYVVLGSINLAGGAVDWLTRLLWGPGPETTALAAAAAVPPGSGGAVWLPHLLGSGTPHADERSRAAVIGLRPEHDRGHLLRALLEGLAYWLRENLDLAVREAGLPGDSEVVTIGGATRSPFWIQLKADVCTRPFRVPRIEESVALGAALLAGAGAGVFADLEQAVASVRVGSDRFTPDPGASALYDRWYASVHQHLYATLREVHAAIDTLQSS